MTVEKVGRKHLRSFAREDGKLEADCLHKVCGHKARQKGNQPCIIVDVEDIELTVGFSAIIAAELQGQTS